MPLPGPTPAQPRPARAAGAAFVLLGILLVAATLRAPITSVAPLLAMIQRDTGLGTAAAGTLTTLPLLAFAAVSPFGAPIARRLGLERSLAWALAAMAAGVALRSAGPAWCWCPCWPGCATSAAWPPGRAGSPPCRCSA